MARGEVGSMLTFAYSSVRGYGDAHPTLGELRVGYLPVEVIHPVTGETVEIGEIMATECEMVSRVYADNQTEADSHTPAKFGLGYGFSFGQSEVKAISMSIIDRVLSAAKERGVHGKSGPATNEEFVLQHIDGIEASGFTAHFKLPHYVTFQADIKVLEQTRQFQADKFSEIKEKREQIAGRKQVFAVTYEDDDDE
jgi:alpha-D-ribose 1-methylphosphonate 5-triphosphate synthase subunit PhnI